MKCKPSPCRFCNSREVFLESDENRRKFYVECNVCAARGSLEKTEEMAVQRWNHTILEQVSAYIETTGRGKCVSDASATALAQEIRDVFSKKFLQ